MKDIKPGYQQKPMKFTRARVEELTALYKDKYPVHRFLNGNEELLIGGAWYIIEIKPAKGGSSD